MASRTGTANGYVHLLDLLRQYTTGNAYESARSFTAGAATVTGNGTLTRVSTKAVAVAEVWTLTCTTAGPTGTFSVVGAVSGTAADATVGVPYTNAQIEFLLSTGGTSFAVGNQFTVTLVASNVPTASVWVTERFTGAGVSMTAPAEMILRGPGAGADAIYVGAKTVNNVAGDWQNWKLGGFTGFVPGSTFELQPGYSGESFTPVHVPLWSADIPFWFVVNGRRIIVAAKISTVFEMLYLGFMQPYATPGQYPYPLFVGGTMAWSVNAPPDPTSVNWRWSYSGAQHSMFVNTVSEGSGNVMDGTGWQGRSQARLRMPTGAWRDFWSGFQFSFGAGSQMTFATSVSDGTMVNYVSVPSGASRAGIWPWVTIPEEQAPAIDGSYVLTPAVLMTGINAGDGPDLLGELEGVYHVTGQGLAAEDIVSVAGVDHVVLQNIARSTRGQFVALALT